VDKARVMVIAIEMAMDAYNMGDEVLSWKILFEAALAGLL